ncbi:multiprotein-bridging factor 1 family protein [Nocardia sp. NBC_00511]|uniref:helix-turn-helix domain-containing protein n=1 Tax=Nocardia sp. NBC_00511 TaxID=2903591 RepID=UPI0030E4378E
MAENWTRLGELVRLRREELGLTQSQVQERGGPSPALVRTLETGRARSMTRSKRRDLERALDWRLGSIDEAVTGGSPAPASEPLNIPNIRQHPGTDGGRGGYEVVRELGSVEPLKLFGLALLANALSEAADDFSKGDTNGDRLVGLAYRTYHASIKLLAESLGVDEVDARETARKMGYLFDDLGPDGSPEQ